ncbi:MAG: sigma-70 family RNA polymerase sigma factor [Planctomycetota bacterium]
MDSAESSQPPTNEHPTASSMLLRRVRQSDPSAWARLVDIFGPVVYHWCRSSGVRQHDAPDLVQDVFTSVARNVGTFERRKANGSFRSWLATITRNRVRDHFRRKSKQIDGEGGTEAMRQLQLAPDDFAESLDESISAANLQTPLVHAVLRQVEGEVEQRTWQAFWMATIQEQPTDVICDALGIPPASVYQAKSRVLRRLRKRLQDLP